MQVTQIKDLLTDITKQILGEEAPKVEDLTNVVDLGKSIFSATDVDNYVKVLVDKVGKVIFKDKKYNGSVPSVFMDNWEFGAVVQKVAMALPEAQDSDSWNLTDGQTYDVNVFHKPTIENKFFNNKVAFEIPMSFTEMQVKSSFNSATELNSFLSMIVTTIENSITVKVDSLIMRTINNMSAQTIKDEFGATTDYENSKGKAINLFALYNATVTTPLTDIKSALTNESFIRFATYTIKLTAERMTKMSKLFNVGKAERFTPISDIRTVLLSDFKLSSDVNVSDLYPNSNVNNLQIDTVPYWQGSGTGYAFDDISKIMVKHGTDTIEFGGIIGVMFDREALGVTNLSKRVTTNYNAKGEFYNNYYKFDAGYFNDLNENFVLFYLYTK